jgi:hypothetical protein
MQATGAANSSRDAPPSQAARPAARLPHPCHLGWHPLPHADPGLWSYNSTTFNNTYWLNTTESTFPEAQRLCRQNGGQVASWPSRAEQAEVEEHFINASYLQPSVHLAYWTGLKTTAAGNPSSFTWADYGVPPPTGNK